MVSTALLATVALASSSAVVLPADAFAPPPPTSIGARGASAATSASGPLGAAAADDDASARALSEYMAKSHVEKLRAVKAAEDAKSGEIEALKAEIEQLKSGSALAVASPAPAAPLASVPSDAGAKLASYQSFMAEYIVNAQNQKLLAVKEAELMAEKKFQERLENLFEASGLALPEGLTPPAPAAAPAIEQTPYQSRNAALVAAADAGKSRWGEMEVAKAREVLASAPSASAAPAAASTAFESRNANVVAAAAAGKSRWGSMEVERAKNGAAAPAEEKAAPKVVTLEDRLNLGARLLGV